jgi:putative transposase
VLEKGINLRYLLGGEAPNKLPDGKSKKNLVENNKIDQVLLDISYGPYLKRDGEMIPTYMILVVNTSTSEIITGEFYLNKSIDTVLLAFEESIERFGVPKVLLIENEKIYNSKTFNKLSKQEKFEVIKFDSNQKEYGVDEVVRRIRNVFLKGLNINRLKGLDQLNLGFKKWIIESQKVNSYSGRWNS